jgi:hypothetical protein
MPFVADWSRRTSVSVSAEGLLAGQFSYHPDIATLVILSILVLYTKDVMQKDSQQIKSDFYDTKNYSVKSFKLALK